MRHLILALMIVLLPLRGWVGDVMATEMASPRAVQLQNATKMVATHAHGAGANGHFDHTSAKPAAAQPVPDCVCHGAGESSSLADAHCESCTVCQACHTVALSPLVPFTPSVIEPPALPRSPAAHFASATAALGQKPPIS